MVLVHLVGTWVGDAAVGNDHGRCAAVSPCQIADLEEDEEENAEKIEELKSKIEEIESNIEELEEEQDNSYCADIFQYYIVDYNGAEILKEINEIVFYNEELDMYVWGVTHFGTSWSYVLTDIKCNVPYENE